MFKRILFLLITISVAACQSETTNTSNTETEPQKVQIKTPAEEVVDSSKNSGPQFSNDYLMGKFDPTKHEDFVPIATKYADRAGMYLRKDTYEAFKQMHAAAEKAGIKLVIRSATRNFTAQKGIWEAKWTGQRILSDGKNAKKDYPIAKDRALKILEYSSMPGTSRHHWGTDVDFNAFNNKYFESGKGKKIYDWLLANAATYRFCQPYTAKGENRPNGYNEEKWHWSYLPIALPLTEQAQARLKNTDIQGFKGAEAAVEIDVIQNYVLGINPACLE